MRTIRLEDIAKKANVSKITVSRVVNEYPHISSKTREKVLAAISELNYTPNLVARSLKTKSSKHIAMVIEDIQNPHFAEMAKGAQDEAKDNGYFLSLSLVTNDDVDGVFKDFLSRSYDGIIYPMKHDILSPEIKERVKKSGIPVVVFTTTMERRNYEIGNNMMMLDSFQGMEDGFKYLMDCGHSEIAYLSGLTDEKNGQKYIECRTQAFCECNQKYFSRSCENYLIPGEPPYNTDAEAGYTSVLKMLNKSRDYTAVIVCNDCMALGAIQAIRNSGIMFPQELSMISFDNSIIAVATSPKLTSIAPRIYDIGRKSVEYIIREIENDEKEISMHSHTFPFYLIPRESVVNLTNK